MSAYECSRLAVPPPALGRSKEQSRLRASLLFGCIIQIFAGHTVAATTYLPSEQQLARCTGRFDYVLPAELRSSGSKQSLYRLDVAQEPLSSSAGESEVWKRKFAATLAIAATSGAAPGPMREFGLRGVGPAAWMQLFADSPDLITLLAMKPMLNASLALFLQMEASPGWEAVAERVITEVSDSYSPGSPQGFCTGSGAFVILPSKNERAIESFTAPGLKVSVQTETVSAPDDGQSTDGLLPPGVVRLLKKSRRVGGFDGIEERVQIVESGNPASLVYTWIFAGRAADGAAPRIRLSATGVASHVAGLDLAWNALLESWRMRPIGVR